MKVLGLTLGVPRFRVRTLLILVAIVAFAIEGGREGFRWLRYRYRHRISAESVWRHDQAAGEKEAWATALDREAESAPAPKAKALREQAKLLRDEAKGYRSLADWSKGLASKYAMAQQTPWLDVPADPPHRASETMIGDPGW